MIGHTSQFRLQFLTQLITGKVTRFGSSYCGSKGQIETLVGWASQAHFNADYGSVNQ